MEWNLKYRQERDNLTFRYRMIYYRTRFGQYKRAYYIAKKKDMEANKKRYEAEAKAKREADAKRKEAEKRAFEK
jgi:predicted metal-binding protein